MAIKKTNQELLKKIFTITEQQYAKKTALATLQDKVNDLVSTGGEPNVLEGVQVNGTALEITNKMVNLLVAAGSADGTISVNGVDISLAGFADLVSTVEGKADVATTLAGYGITDGMTATEIASAISTAIAGADHLQRQIVTSTDDIDLTAEDAAQYIYMVPNEEGESGNTYDEYMVINGTLERVGDWKVDLSDYATTAAVTTAIATALADYAKTEDVNSAINTAITGLITLGSLSVVESGTGNVVTAVSYDNTTGVFTVTKGITALTEDDFEEFTDDEISAAFTEAEAAAAE